MSKLKLNIQYFASTNSTTHYDLSQYVASDKPTYLIDYNQDMAKIDAGIYGAMSKATVNESNIGTMQDLTTTAKNNLVSAINEINTQLGTNTTNIGINASNIATLGTNQGDLVNLMTTAKNNLVSAINELKGVNDTQNTSIAENTARINNFNLTHFDNITTGTKTGTGSLGNVNITVAYNDDGSLCKIYGNVETVDYVGDVYIQTALRPTTAFSVANSVFRYRPDNNTMGFQNITINPDGTVKIPVNSLTSTTSQLIPILIFVKDFGDVPTPTV